MPARRPQRPPTRLALLPSRVQDKATQRAFDEVNEHLEGVTSSGVLQRQVLTFDLVVGTNKVSHGLGRPVRGYTLTPTVADATFAHALADGSNTQRTVSVWITVVGVNQPGATLELY